MTHLGRHRWVVERTISWLLRFKRLGVRYDRTEATVVPLLLLAVTLINLRRLAQRTQVQARRTAREVAAYQTTANNPRVPTE